MSSKRKFCFLEWVVIDNCNLDCSYCVNKGKYSQKNASQMKYVPGVELQVAKKIRSISPQFEKIVVNLTGGEPTVALHIVEAVKELAAAGNVEIRLITNLKATDRFEEIAPYLSSLLVSLHLDYRSNDDVERIISVVNAHKSTLPITLSQVNHDMSSEVHDKLARIKAATRLPISYQTFIPPWTDDGKMGKKNEISVANFQKSLGKRCSLGYFYFFIETDGTLRYDLWCSPENARNTSLLLPELTDLSTYVLDDMGKCPKLACGCNYNYCFHDLYLQECHQKGYSQKEIFLGNNLRIMSKILRIFSKIKTSVRAR